MSALWYFILCNDKRAVKAVYVRNRDIYKNGAPVAPYFGMVKRRSGEAVRRYSGTAVSHAKKPHLDGEAGIVGIVDRNSR